MEIQAGCRDLKSKLTFPLAQLLSALPNSLQTLLNGCLCEDEKKLSVDFISKCCLLEFTQEEGKLLSRLDHGVSRLQSPAAAFWLHLLKQKLLKQGSVTQIKSRATWALNPKAKGISQTGQLLPVASSP